MSISITVGYFGDMHLNLYDTVNKITPHANYHATVDMIRLGRRAWNRPTNVFYEREHFLPSVVYLMYNV